MNQPNFSVTHAMLFAPIIALVISGCEATDDPPIAADNPPTEASEETGGIDFAALEARYGERLYNAEELPGWVESQPFIHHFADGSCRNFLRETNSDVRLIHCAFDITETYNLNVVREFNAQADPLVDLKSSSEFSYEIDYELVGFLDNENPKYSLLLEQDGFVFSASLVVPGDDPFLGAADLAAGFDAETDELLHRLMTRSLESGGS